MKVVIQRVQKASVTINDECHASIDSGLLILLGITHNDTAEDIDYLTRKISGLRIFADEQGQMNNNIIEVEGAVLVVSQFTLFANTKKGNRPSYINAAPPNLAESLYRKFVETLSRKLNKNIPTGKFGADMQVRLINDGPVTIIIDSQNR